MNSNKDNFGTLSSQGLFESIVINLYQTTLAAVVLSFKALSGDEWRRAPLSHFIGEYPPPSLPGSGESVGEWREVVALCKGIQDSLGFWDSIPWIPYRGFRIPSCWIPVYDSGTWILDLNL